jgi:pantoate--beta-alanine ligase
VAADVGKGRAADDSCSEAADALRSADFGEIDYVVVRDSETLAEITQPLARPARVLAAAWLGKTRLIDNVACPARQGGS